MDDAGQTGYTSSLAEVNGQAAISYNDASNGSLRFVRAKGLGSGKWGTSVTVDTARHAGQHTSLAIINGKPAISYCDFTNGDLCFVIGY
ncbi:hypothetical protein IT575_13975 [bacterium]|nr:hypothetical protein [bacterium]